MIRIYVDDTQMRLRFYGATVSRGAHRAGQMLSKHR